ncbi:elongation factor P 5-aminopentanone reductase [Salinibacillus xinjiangensis]|uniref:SDR family oxidoreductase n=1 Tax=Salinibacillus xinjiangensis TaxID=1229268 RepID=A0A6G1X2X2_9BACI|nr:SDR family oxidoreductase [Salinibacillus xinjiangensis]MRG85337.1 SDR family oxidoreductase [Salinibacillus xinjiangensis]
MKTCLITGASGGIGGSIANKLVQDGWQVILHCNQNLDGLIKQSEQFPEESVLAYIQADLSTSDGVDALLKQLHFQIDAFVHASGKATYGLFQDVQDMEIDEMFHLHIKAPMKISRYLLSSMIKRTQGKIVLISSMWGEIGASLEVLYSTVKGAQNTFVKALAKEAAASGIQVNAVSPGFIDTKMNDRFTSEEREEFIASIPQQKAGRAEDVANTVCFLLSESAQYINGQIIGVNGGYTS